jgi:hypothetical protein
VIWIRSPGQKVDVNTVTSASFGISTAKLEFASALIYKLQRKKRFGSKDQSNVSNTLTEGTSISLRLLVIWGYNVKYENRSTVRALLIKHSDEITWNEDKLEKLHSMYFDLLKDDYSIKDTWLLDDATVLITTSRWRSRDCVTKITISEGTRKNDSMEPLCVPSSICV